MNKFYYLDCEWDTDLETGETTLLSLALVDQEIDFYGYVIVEDDEIKDPWVRENVLPKLDVYDYIDDWSHHNLADLKMNFVDHLVEHVLPNDSVTIVADHPKDIEWFTKLINLGGGDYAGKGKELTCLIIPTTVLAESPSYMKHLKSGGNTHNAYDDAEALCIAHRELIVVEDYSQKEVSRD